MEQQRTRQEAAEKLLKRMNRIFLIPAIFFLLLSLSFAGATAFFRFTPYYLTIMIIGTFTVAIISIFRKLSLLSYVVGTLTGTLSVLLIALWGFYNPAMVILNYTTLRPNKSFGNAIIYAFLGPESLTASRLFACDTTTSSACTRFQDSLGTELDYAILIGGVMAGTVLARRKLPLDDWTQSFF